MKSEMQKRLFSIARSFHNLNVRSMMPDITQGEFYVLRQLKDLNDNQDGVVIVSDLSKRLRMAPPGVSRMLKSLEEKGLIERAIDTRDRRNTIVIFTEQGLQLFDEMEKIMNDFADAVFAQFETEEMDQLCHCLEKLYAVADREIQARNYHKRKEENE